MSAEDNTMSEEIRDEELENVSGGYDFYNVPLEGWEEGITHAGAIEVD